MKKKNIIFLTINVILFLVARKETFMFMAIPHLGALCLLCATATLIEGPMLIKKDGTGASYVPMFTTMTGVIFGWFASLWSDGPVTGDILALSLFGSVTGYFLGLMIVWFLSDIHSFPRFFQ